MTRKCLAHTHHSCHISSFCLLRVRLYVEQFIVQSCNFIAPVSPLPQCVMSECHSLYLEPCYGQLCTWLWCWHPHVCSRCSVTFWFQTACVVLVTSVRDTSTNLIELTLFEDRTPTLCGPFFHLQSSRPIFLLAILLECSAKSIIFGICWNSVSVKMQRHLETKTYFVLHTFMLTLVVIALDVWHTSKLYT